MGHSNKCRNNFFTKVADTKTLAWPPLDVDGNPLVSQRFSSYLDSKPHRGPGCPVGKLFLHSRLGSFPRATDARSHLQLLSKNIVQKLCAVWGRHNMHIVKECEQMFERSISQSTSTNESWMARGEQEGHQRVPLVRLLQLASPCAAHLFVFPLILRRLTVSCLNMALLRTWHCHDGMSNAICACSGGECWTLNHNWSTFASSRPPSGALNLGQFDLGQRVYSS